MDISTLLTGLQTGQPLEAAGLLFLNVYIHIYIYIIYGFICLKGQ